MKRNDNERSKAIDLIVEANKFLDKTTIRIKRAGGEITLKNNSEIEGRVREIMFPDLLLFSDEEGENIIQGWEIKMPDISINNTAFIKDAQYKADVMGLDTAVLWNFKDVALYSKKNEKWKKVKQWYGMENIKNREDVNANRSLWIRKLQEVLLDVNKFLGKWDYKPKKIYEVTNTITHHLINDNKVNLAKYIKEKSLTDQKINAYIKEWWRNTKQEFMKDESDPFVAYSKTILLGWITRFIFAHIISETHDSARKVMELNENTTPDKANVIFSEITKSSDFYTIFLNKKYDNLIPYQIWRMLLDFNEFLKKNTVTHESLQIILENSINRYKREIEGQFTTPPPLAKIITTLTINDITGNTIDPCCGSGTIAKEIINLKSSMKLKEEEIHQTTWAADKMSMPLQITNLSITSASSINIINKVFQKNLLKLSVGDNVDFISPSNGEKISFAVPEFTSIVSNLPFVKSSEISKEDKEEINKIYDDTVNLGSGREKLSKRADYSMYLFLHLRKLVQENGRIGVILSNSWLGTEWGITFLKTVLRDFKIEHIIISGGKKWFNNAKVSTSILIVTKKVEKDNNAEINFVKIMENIYDLKEEEIDHMCDSIILGKANSLITIDKYTEKEMMEILKYNVSINSLFFNVKWLNNVIDKMTPLKSKFDVFRGMRRGWDQLFYPNENNEIEDEFKQNVLSNSKSIKTYNTKADGIAFCCSLSLDELKSKGYEGALAWINLFEYGVNKKGVRLTKSLSTSKYYWYEMNPEGSIAELVTSLNPFNRIFWAKLDKPTFINQRLIGMSRNKENQNENLDIYMAILNSILGLFYIESTGFGRGEGVLDTNKGNIEKIMILNPDLLDLQEKEEIVNKFYEMNQEIPSDVRDDINNEIRIEFDKLVLRKFGIEYLYQEIKDSFIDMMNTRLSNRKNLNSKEV